jgi:hypothetical protein
MSDGAQSLDLPMFEDLARQVVGKDGKLGKDGKDGKVGRWGRGEIVRSGG